MAIILLTLSVKLSVAQPTNLDLGNSTLRFVNSNRSVIVDKGNEGLSQGSVHRYDGLITKNGISVYGLLTIDEIKNAVILNFDDDVTFGTPGRFQPAIGTTSSDGGYIVYQLRFFNSATNDDIFLYNYSITGIDLDGINFSNREFVEHEGNSSYTVNNNSQLQIANNAITGRTRFLGRTRRLSGMGFDNTCSYIITYDSPNNSISFTLGQTGQNTKRDYSLQFGTEGGAFSNPYKTISPLLVAIDDIGTPVNSNTGGSSVANVLSNDFFNGQQVEISKVVISISTPASDAGVTLNTSTGIVSVAPGTPAGLYTLKYQICMAGNPANRCDLATVKVKVLSADLSISMIDFPDTVIAGQNVTYTISVHNNGISTARLVWVTDNLPAGLSFISATPSVGTWSGSTWNIGEMHDSTSEQIVIVARVASNYTGNIQNTAKVISSIFDPVILNNTISQLTAVTSSADISIVITDFPDPIDAGQNIIYSIAVTNNGPSDALNVEVKDSIPAGLTIIDTDLSAGTWAYPKWTIGKLENGKSATLNIEASLNEGLTGKISNKATVTSATPDQFLANNSSLQVTTINTSADLSVKTTFNADTLIAGEVVSISVLISNNGLGNAHSIQLFDIIPPEIQYVIYTIDDGLTWPSWSSNCLIGSLNAGDSVKIVIVGSLISSAIQGSVISNTAFISSSTPDHDLSNNTNIKTVSVSKKSEMSIVMTGPLIIAAGTKITYSLSVINNGPSNSSSLVISDILPASITNAEVSFNDGNSWDEWNGARNIPIFNYPGENTILIRGDVLPEASGILINQANVSSATVDNVLTNNSSTVSTLIVREADLILSKVETVSPLLNSDDPDNVNYEISVLNNGPSDASSVIITDIFDPGIISGVKFLDDGFWKPWPDSLSFNILKKDSSITIEIQGTINTEATGPIENTASVTSLTTDPNRLNNKQTIRTPFNKDANLSVSLTFPPKIIAGDTIQYSITISNLSSSISSVNVSLTDITDNLKIKNQEYSTNGGSSWSIWSGRFNIGPLNSGASSTFLMRGIVNSNARGILRKKVQVFSDTPDSEPENNIAIASAAITILSDVSIVKSLYSSPEEIIEGSTIKYLLTYRNNGPSDADNFVITDNTSASLTNVETIQNASEYIPWSGSLNVGTVVAKGTGSLIIKGTIKNGILGTISNTASVSSEELDTILNNNSSQISAIVKTKADLSISISGLPNPVIAGNVVIYTLSVENNGPSNASNVDISYPKPSGFISNQFSIDGGLTWNNWVGSYRVANLPARNSYDIIIRSIAKNDLVNGSIYSFSASVSSLTNDPVLENNSFQISSTVQTKADLAIDILVDNNTPSVGDLVQFTISATNHGPSNAVSVNVTDFIPSGYNYQSDNGNGSFNQATGVWTIGSMVYTASVQLNIIARVLPTGNYLNTSIIAGEDDDPDYSNNSASKTVVPDIEAIYSIIFPQNVDSYSTGQTLATVTDGDGNVVSATVSSGILPPGIVLDTVSGRILVADSTKLKAGSYSIIIRTTDAKGGKTNSPVSIIINPDSESVYYVTTPKNVDEYATGEVFASVTDFDSAIKSFTINSENLPSGTAFSSQTGEMMVANPSNLVAGIFSITVSTVDEKGGKTTQNVRIEFLADSESVYEIRLPKRINDYLNGDTLATVTDNDGEIISVELVANILPTGSSLNPLTGEITIVDYSLLIAGNYTVRIKTIDEEGGTTSQLVTIFIKNKDGSVYTVEPARNVDAYRNGDRLAFVLNSNGEVNSAILESGTLPPGAVLNLVSGEIKIVDSSLLVAGSYTATIKVNNAISLAANILINPDIESVYLIEPSRNLFSYVNGDILASVTDVNGRVVSSIILNGTLPAGLALNPVSGEISVVNVSALEAKTFSFSIKTTDITGGITIQPVIISFVAADLSVTLSCSPQIIVAGEKLIYTLTVTNNGPNEANNVKVTDLLPAGLTIISSNPSVGNWTSPNWNIGTLANGAIATLLIEAQINSSMTGTLTDTATVTSTTSDNVTGNNRATINSTINSRANLLITLAASPNPVIAGENETYTVTVVNNGPSDAVNLVLTDNLPDNVNFVSASDGGILTTRQVKWSLNKLQTGGSKIFTLVVNVGSNLSEGSVITNRAAIVADNSGTQVFSNLNEILVKTSSKLTIKKTASSYIVPVGDNFTYTITATNNGPSDAKNVRITDVLPTSLTFVSASGNGLFENGIVTWFPITLAKGNNFSFTLVVAVKGSVANGTVITNKAIVTSDSSEKPVESEPENVLVEAKAKLEIVKTVSKEVVVAGEEVTYSISIKNAGLSDATNIILTDSLPSGLTFVSASNGGIVSNSVVNWLETRMTGNTAKSYSVTVRVNKNVLKGTTIKNRAYAKCDNSGPNIQSIPVIITVDAISNLVIQKSGNVSVISGKNINYSIQVTNNGPSDAPNVLVSDKLPIGVSFVSASDGGIVSNGFVNWNLTSLISGATKIFTFIVKVDENITNGTRISNTATIICDNSISPVESNEVITTVTTLSIIANDDIGNPVNGANGGIVVVNVLANDFSGATIVDPSLVNISLVSSSSQKVNLNLQTGEVNVSNTTPAAIYQLVYRICLKEYPTICDDATVNITVLAAEIKANNDIGLPVNNNDGGVAVEDVTSNDLLNGETVGVSDVKISLVSPASVSGIDLDLETGEVTVGPGIQPGEYEISYRICEILNPANCDDAKATVTIEFDEECEFLVPTGFSPNDDGIHDYFMIKCIEKYPDATFEVYNRWGNLVYKKDKYGNADQWGEADAWWDGSSNQKFKLGDEKLPPGTYYFVLKLNKGEEKPISGTVFLNR